MVEIKIDRESDTPLYAQIREALAEMIKTGKLSPGERLPTVAAFSKNIGVTASTVRRALEDLTRMGQVKCHVGRGTFVCDTTVQKRHIDTETQPTKPSRTIKNFPGDFQTWLGSETSFASIVRLARKPGLTAFIHGILDNNLFNKKTFEAVLKETASIDIDKLCRENSQGHPELRQAITARYAKEGHAVTEENILITGGVQQAAFIMGNLARKTGMGMICETPGYMGMRDAYTAQDTSLVHITRDFHGPDPGTLESMGMEGPSMLSICPIFNNPMGTSMGPERKKEILDWAKRENSLILSDEIFQELYYDGTKPQGFVPEIEGGNAIAMNSFSKSYMTGVRTGWIVASRELIPSILHLKRANDKSNNTFIQAMLASLMQKGLYDRELANLRDHYRKIRDIIINALEKHMPEGVCWNAPAGGLHIWVQLPENCSSIDLLMMTVERGVSFIPGPLLDVDKRFHNAFRMSFGIIAPQDIEPGIKKLAQATRKLMKKDTLSSLGDSGDFL